MCECSDRAEGLVALFDDVLQLSQHCDLSVLQLQLLCGGICYACLVGGLRFISLHTRKLFFPFTLCVLLSFLNPLHLIG